MTTVVLAKKPSQARSYVEAMKQSTKNRVTMRLVTLFCLNTNIFAENIM